jgi:hypothetical protein
MRHVLLATAAIMAASPSVAQTQAKVTDVVVMRQKLAPPKATPTPTPTPSLYSTCTGISLNQGPDTGANPAIASNSVSSASAAQDACTAYLTTNKLTVTGVCYYVLPSVPGGNSYAGKAVFFPGTTLRTPYGDQVSYYGALCTKK